jgi:hypothetical protein
LSTLAPSTRRAAVAVPAPGASGVDTLTRVMIVLAFATMPILVPVGPGNWAPADVFSVLAIGAVVLRVSWTQEPLRAAYLLGGGVIVLAGLVSSFAGSLPVDGLLAVVQDIFLLVWAAALTTFLRTPEGAQFLVRCWATTACLWAAVFVAFTGPALVASTAGGPVPERAGFSFGEQNAAGLYFVLSMMVVLAARRPRPLALRVGGLFCLAMATLATGSLGAISGLLAGLAVAVVLGVRSRRGAALGLAVAVAVPLALGSVALYSQRHDVVAAAHSSDQPLIRNSIGRGYQSSESRAVLARETLHLWSTSDLWGRGPVSTEAALRAEQSPYPKEAHNDWIAALVERGVLGICGLLLLVGEIVLLAGRTWDVRRLLPGYAAALPAPHLLVGSLATLLIFSMTHEVLHDRSAWTLLGLLAGVGIWGSGLRRPERGVVA